MARYEYEPRAEEEIKPWDRQEGEPPEAFAAFVVYRDMVKTVRKRSVDEAYFMVYPERRTEGKRSHWLKFSSMYKWKDRTEAYDIYLESITRQAAEQAISVHAERLGLNRNAFKENEVYLADQGLRMVKQILEQPLITDEYVERRNNKTIIHKRTLLSPAHLIAAATLLKVSSEIGRKGLGISPNSNEEEVTPEQFRDAFYKTTGRLAKDLPTGALPPMPAQTAAKPEFDVPGDGSAFDAALSGSGVVVEAPANGANGANSNGHNEADGGGASVSMVKGQIIIRSERERP